MDMTKQTNVELFNHWMTDIVKSKWAHNENSMCHARAIVATHHIITANKKINGSN